MTIPEDTAYVEANRRFAEPDSAANRAYNRREEARNRRIAQREDAEYEEANSGGVTGNLGGSLILLLLALLLLYLAVTDRLSNFLDGIDVMLGKKKVPANALATALPTTTGTPVATVSLTTLPRLSSLTDSQVAAV